MLCFTMVLQPDALALKVLMTCFLVLLPGWSIVEQVRCTYLSASGVGLGCVVGALFSYTYFC